ncbi:DUF6197 family protein [Spirilliplanes yamanashiensis]|uniref:Uncharacterized protein n=1 Tax=Spirilliplanes yamanashiensis TaxID=42233 RepID=A0A8J3Y497_9ACTN|nr:hypothetical protein [Spirilliplanes yamanashiensis]MDP9819962.1 hypothetical protein [Spirilliplanes yamanashiensis]GIJ01219.1 hypothetical protein Sya03_05710 [Spirilliplanes yamanashiensis]
MKATHNPPTETRPTPAELLRGAATYLRLHGWTTGQFYDLTGGDSDAFPPACTAGAITIAAYGRFIASGICTLDEPEPEHYDAMRAMRFLADYLDSDRTPDEGFPPSSIDVIGDWNDHPGRTLDEVVDALTTAANEWSTATAGSIR